jgi:hypothetical protein
MKSLLMIIISSILSSSLYAEGTHLFNQKSLPSETQVEVTLKNVELAPHLNDYNLFFLGDNDFEMIIMLNGHGRLIEFPLKANNKNSVKKKNLFLDFKVKTKDLNYAIDIRRNYEALSYDEKKYIRRAKLGQLCLLDDSLMSPGFITTSYYGCFDLAYVVQEMISNKVTSKKIAVVHDTNFPVSSDPKKEKLFKSWYTVKILK